MSLPLSQNMNTSTPACQERWAKWPHPTAEFPLASQLPWSAGPTNILWKLIKYWQPTVACNAVSYWSLALFRLSRHLLAFRRILQRCFLAWGQLPRLQREERVKEGRRERLAWKVVDVLPDFQLAETFWYICNNKTSETHVPMTDETTQTYCSSWTHLIWINKHFMQTRNRRNTISGWIEIILFTNKSVSSRKQTFMSCAFILFHCKLNTFYP